jgi:hypothetical protein
MTRLAVLGPLAVVVALTLVPAVRGQTPVSSRGLTPLAVGYAAAFGCDSASIVQAATEALQNRLRHQWQPDEPKVGDNACEVLAALGLPDRERHLATEFGESWYWTWLVAEEPRLITLGRPGPEYGWSVTAVVW